MQAENVPELSENVMLPAAVVHANTKLVVAPVIFISVTRWFAVILASDTVAGSEDRLPLLWIGIICRIGIFLVPFVELSAAITSDDATDPDGSPMIRMGYPSIASMRS